MTATPDTVEATAVDVDLSLEAENEIECCADACSKVAVSRAVFVPCACSFELCQTHVDETLSWLKSGAMGYHMGLPQWQCHGRGDGAGAVRHPPTYLLDIRFEALR